MMNTYVNRFSFALNDRKRRSYHRIRTGCTSVCIQWRHREVDYEPVANLVMSQHIASELAKKLLEALNGDDTALIETPVQ